MTSPVAIISNQALLILWKYHRQVLILQPKMKHIKVVYFINKGKSLPSNIKSIFLSIFRNIQKTTTTTK